MTVAEAVRELVCDLGWDVIVFDEVAGSPENPVITKVSQNELALAVHRLAGGEKACLMPDPADPSETGFMIGDLVYTPADFRERLKVLLSAVDISMVAEAYRLVMGVGAQAIDGHIVIETELEQFRCVQCGRCCRYLDGAYIACARAEDLERWRQEGRADILAYTVKGYLWVSPETGEDVTICPWLRKLPGQDRYRCHIQETKPVHCRNYPLSKKNALRCGCRGFEHQRKG